MIVVTVNFEAKPDKVEEFKTAILAHATRCLEREPGCLQFDVSQDRKNPERFFLYEVYVDKEAFDAHRNSPHMAENGKVIPDLIAKRDLALFSMVPGAKPKR